ncbi:MAG: YeeE/YedE thiosulfate transporter family protein [Nitrospirota bacterium]
MLKTIILGMFFGAILQNSRVNTFNKIGGFAMMKDFTAAKVLLTAVGAGSILLFIEIQLGAASLSIKPFDVTGVIAGGLIFGVGMAVLGYCPGTLLVSIGEGAVDAVIGTAGGLLAGLVYIVLYPQIEHILGPNLGKVNLYTHSAAGTALVVLLLGALFIGAAFYLDKKEKNIV